MRNQLIISPRTIRFQSRDPIFQFQTIFQTQDATVFRCPSFLISSDCHLKKKMFRWPSRFALWFPPPPSSIHKSSCSEAFMNVEKTILTPPCVFHVCLETFSVKEESKFLFRIKNQRILKSPIPWNRNRRIF